MKLAISNIAWDEARDLKIYDIMKRYEVTGLEIAPTRIFPQHPYEHVKDATLWKKRVSAMYGFEIPSIQSIWFGRQENLFSSVDERDILINYTKKAIDFAMAIGCTNIVFGCPRNRNSIKRVDGGIAISFFKEIGEYAYRNGTIVGLEPNPISYNTNFINNTLEAIELIQEVNSKGLKLNLDVGTMIENGETVNSLREIVSYINHVHISEPGLKTIQKRDIHSELCSLLKDVNYQGYISIEMKKTSENEIEDTLHYMREVFYDL